MWAYQHHFVPEVKYLSGRVCELVGAPFRPDVLLVGVRSPEASPGQPICLEPCDEGWSLAAFADLEAQIAHDILMHPMQKMFYGDRRAMDEKPANIRRMVIRETILERLKPDDAAQGTITFADWPRRVGDYDVVTILQAPRDLFDQYASLHLVGRDGEAYDTSFLRSCLTEILSAVGPELFHPDPGRGSRGGLKAEEIVLRAAHSFGRNATGQVTKQWMGEDLFEAMNEIAALRYEGSETLGRLIFVDPKVDEVDWVCRLADPVPLRDVRWARKLLQMATLDLPMIASTQDVLGIGRLSGPTSEARTTLTAEFHSHQDWTLWCGDAPLMRTIRSRPQLPQEVVGPERFSDTAERLFRGAAKEQVARLWELLKLQSRRPHGSLLIIAEDAAAEVGRLAGQATLIEPTPISDELLAQASRVDGAILIDPAGVCHAFGVVLDGPARPECTPARGGRYNSAVRYVTEPPVPRMAIVASDDRTVDVIPILRPRLSRDALERAVVEAEGVEIDTYHRPLNLLRGLRFYLSAAQCERLNGVITRLRAAPYRGTELRVLPELFEPHPDMNDSYFL